MKLHRAITAKKLVFGLAVLLGGGLGLSVVDAFGADDPDFKTCTFDTIPQNPKRLILSCKGEPPVVIDSLKKFLNLKYKMTWNAGGGKTEPTFPDNPDFSVEGLFDVDKGLMEGLTETTFAAFGQCLSYMTVEGKKASGQDSVLAQLHTPPCTEKIRLQICDKMFGLKPGEAKSKSMCDGYLSGTELTMRWSPKERNTPPPGPVTQFGSCRWLWHTSVACLKPKPATATTPASVQRACADQDRCIGAMICHDSSGAWQEPEMVSCAATACNEDKAGASDVSNGHKYGDLCKKGAFNDLTPVGPK